MNRSQVIFFAAVLILVIAIAKHNSKMTDVTQNSPASPSPSSTLAPANSPSPVATAPALTSNNAAQLTRKQREEFGQVASKSKPAMVLLSVFDDSGKLLRNGTGFFVSEDGKLATSQSVVAGGAHAVAKTSGGRIYNVSGILATGGTTDVVILKAEPKQHVAFLPLSKNAVEEGTAIAVLGNPVTGRDPLLEEGKISRKQSEQIREVFELSVPIPNELGSAAVDEKGEVVGIITQSHNGNVLRSASALTSLVAQIDSGAKVGWQVASLRNSQSPPPAEGPLPSPKPKIPLAGPESAGNSRLVYSPAPGYPKTGSHSSRPLKGSGRFRVTFTRNGEVKDVGIVQSTRDPALDNAALEALRRWKARPGQEWTANVPITFQP
jgi:TonB family protein